eukprot:353272-Chlamydomonas_euryale.AAC.8
MFYREQLRHCAGAAVQQMLAASFNDVSIRLSCALNTFGEADECGTPQSDIPGCSWPAPTAVHLTAR